jgi:hypothetical protein
MMYLVFDALPQRLVNYSGVVGMTSLQLMDVMSPLRGADLLVLGAARRAGSEWLVSILLCLPESSLTLLNVVDFVHLMALK